MITVQNTSDPRLIASLVNGGLAVLRTDTIYGIVAKASLQKSVERIFELKRRAADKPLIVLVSSIDDIPHIDSDTKACYEALSKERPTTLIVPDSAAPSWLTRGQGSVAYRIPHVDHLCRLIDQTGPLVAPSANPQSLHPASNIEEAIAYFDDSITIYVDGGTVPADTLPSRIVEVRDGSIYTLRH